MTERDGTEPGSCGCGVRGITGTRWEWARKLFEQGEGDKYWIYVVSSDTKITPLNDPIKLWKEGKLCAHPANFKL